FHEYGLRDDYSNLREAHEEPGAVVKFCASHARPIYGWLLKSTYGQTSSVHNLEWLRLLASLLLGAISLVMFRGLRLLGWSLSASLWVATLLALLPASQVIAGWAVGWPYAAAALLAIGGYFTAEGALANGRRNGFGRMVGQWTVALGLMLVSALIYQPSALFYVVPFAAALITQRQREFNKPTAHWAAAHLALLVAALGLAFCTMTALYSLHVFVKSGRIAFEHHWGEKISWFLSEPLPNALSMLVLNDNNHRGHALYMGCAALVGLILVAGAYLEWQRHGRARGLAWSIALVTLPVFAFAVNMLASERYATYRTVLAMSAVLLCFLVASLRALTEHWSLANRRLLASVVMGTAFFTAQHHVYALIAVPQGNEWQLILDGAKRVKLSPMTRPQIFAITSTPVDISTASIYHDEFGSLSSNSEWVPKEMFKRAMHDLHPEIANINAHYEFAEGPKLPVDQRYDLVIDMRRLKQFYTDN
ncbi:MAG TPA: glucosyltransferase domain-containing protein, partial [Steroidobacteraceae bacterium]|nr:glucosyltransferase domain-containing protein [Steroidobacteraceae bacterium]